MISAYALALSDTPAITVSSISGNTTETGDTATFSVVLSAEPTADVTINMSSSDETEGTISISSLIFTNTDWDVSQTVTVNGVDDDIADGNQNYYVILSEASSSDGDRTHHGGLAQAIGSGQPKLLRNSF